MKLKNKILTGFSKTTKVPSNHEILQKNEPPQPPQDEENETAQDQSIKTIKVAASHLEFSPKEEAEENEIEPLSRRDTITSFAEAFSSVAPLAYDIPRRIRVRFDSGLNLLKTKSEVIRETEDVDPNAPVPPENIKSIMKVTKDHYRIEQLRYLQYDEFH